MPPEFMTNAYDREVAENARVGDYVGAPITAARAGTSYTLSSSNGDDAFLRYRHVRPDNGEGHRRHYGRATSARTLTLRTRVRLHRIDHGR